MEGCHNQKKPYDRYPKQHTYKRRRIWPKLVAKINFMSSKLKSIRHVIVVARP
jgi:hypothetical protein